MNTQQFNNPNTQLKAVRNILEKHEKAALLIGNGPNLAAQIMPSWKQLLTSVSSPPIHFNVEGLSNTEVYDLVALHSRKGHDVKEHVIRELAISPEQSLPIHQRLMELAQAYNAPVLTTNFDSAFEKSIDAKQVKINSKGFTRYYPWKTYYGFQQHESPTDGFGIWKVHGDVRYKDSIRLGLTDYMGSVERARGMIHKGSSRLFRSKRKGSSWTGQDSWLHIWFNLPVIIFGLGFGADEVFLRWLLIERRRYFNYHKKPMHVYFVSKEDVPPATENLMENLGVTMISIQEYSELYG